MTADEPRIKALQDQIKMLKEVCDETLKWSVAGWLIALALSCFFAFILTHSSC